MLKQIIESANSWGGWPHQNSQLELASMALEARLVTDIEPLADLYFKQLDATIKRTGVYSRSPGDSIANSKDNVVYGLACLSFLFDHGTVAAQVLDQGPWYFSGKNEHGKWFDGEWFMLMHPAHRALLKLACGREPNCFEDWGLRKSLVTSTVWNTLRVRLLFLYAVGYYCPEMETAQIEMGTKYRGRYGDNPIYLALWEANQGRYK